MFEKIKIENFLGMESGGSGEDGMMMIMGGRKREMFMAEMKKQLWLGGPLVSVNCLLFCLQLISVMFVGHLGELALAGASMATSFAGVTGFSLLTGMSCALDTFCGQAYGAKQYHMLGIYLQRSMLVLTLVSIPIAIIWANTGKILMNLKQNAEISIAAGEYARWMIPTIFAQSLLQSKLKFLQTQNIVFPMAVSSGITALVHLPLCWVLVFKSGLGSRGAALANGISYWVNVAFLAIYVKLSDKCKDTWVGFSKDAFKELPRFLKVAIPSAFMVCLEFWAFEMMILLAGILPNPKLETSVLSISLNTTTMAFMIVSGLSSVISIRVSNELGSERPRAAHFAIYVTMSMAAVESITFSAAMMLLRDVWGKLYSNEVEVVKHVAAMMPLLATSTFLDTYQCVLSGIVRGCGKQKIGAFVNLGAYYAIGLPSGVLFAFIFHFRGKGLWLGITCALAVQLVLLTIVTVFTNWEKEANNAKTRVSSSSTPIEITITTTESQLIK